MIIYHVLRKHDKLPQKINLSKNDKFNYLTIILFKDLSLIHILGVALWSTKRPFALWILLSDQFKV